MSFDFIPIQQYTPLYYHILLCINLFTFLHTQILRLEDTKNLNYIKVTGVVLLSFVLLYMGLRPIHGVFVDMTTYAHSFTDYANGMEITSNKDYLFHIFLKGCSQIMPIHFFFFLCASLYVVPCYVISKKWFGKYWFYAFLMLVSSFSFWTYGTNGIRNGIGTSLFLLALSNDKKIYQLLWMTLSISFHATLMLPSLALIITWFYNNNKAFYIFWGLCIPLSLAFPGFWESLIGSLVNDQRSNYFTDKTYADSFSSSGFRWDFLLYSATGVLAGWYYIYQKKLEDKKYKHLFNIYLFTNAFWILVIRASFSNRFAYLSWFLLALVIVYPWLTYFFEKQQHSKLGFIMLSYFGFTYFMQFIYYGKF